MTERQMIERQNQLRERIVPHNQFDEAAVETVAGVDIAYWQHGEREYGVCCIAVVDICSGHVVEDCHFSGVIEVPYIPGLLAFREVPLVLGAVERLRARPDIYMFDGNGILHSRRMGLATQAGILLGVPSIGVAKSYYRVGGAAHEMPRTAAGSHTDIMLEGEVCGRVLRTHDGVKPVFLSVGTGIDLDTATRLTLRLVGRESHIPAPTRLADLATHEQRARLRAEG